MKIIAAVHTRRVRSYIGGTFNPETRTVEYGPKAEYVAGSHIAFVVEKADGLLYFMNDEKTEVYGTGERVSRAMKDRIRATLAARRHFGKDIIVG